MAESQRGNPTTKTSFVAEVLDMLADNSGRGGVNAIATAVEAHARATLAVAEQLRIRNLIELAKLGSSFADELGHIGDEAALGLIEIEPTPATPYAGPDEVADIRPEIRAALGL